MSWYTSFVERFTICYRYFRIPCLLWAMWMIVGTVFYSIGDKFGWQRGFYLAVNVGYAIGWGYPLDPTRESQWFSTFFVIVGSCLCAYTAGCFLVLITKPSWPTMSTEETGIIQILWNFASCFRIQIGIISFFMIWIFIMQMWALFSIPGWMFIDSLYFAISSCSSGGLIAIPNNSPLDYFAVVGALTLLGVPIMRLAVISFVDLYFQLFQSHTVRRQLNHVAIDSTHIQTLSSLGKDTCRDGLVDKVEYILLCCMQVKLIASSLVRILSKHYDESYGTDLTYVPPRARRAGTKHAPSKLFISEPTPVATLDSRNSWYLYKAVMSNRFIFPILLWLPWITSGTIYYACGDRFGWALGFYMAVNVGYSVGWG